MPKETATTTKAMTAMAAIQLRCLSDLREVEDCDMGGERLQELSAISKGRDPRVNWPIVRDCQSRSLSCEHGASALAQMPDQMIVDIGLDIEYQTILR